tara:strand:- start:25 stop:297 length:273 start_codon:yes stop_codon:yes gene_type:complete
MRERDLRQRKMRERKMRELRLGERALWQHTVRSELATSSSLTQRVSSGLSVNESADAAGTNSSSHAARDDMGRQKKTIQNAKKSGRPLLP